MDLGKKAGNTVNFENVSGDVPFTELTSNQFIEGMKKIYDLEPLINAQKLEALALEKANASAVRIR